MINCIKYIFGYIFYKNMYLHKGSVVDKIMITNTILKKSTLHSSYCETVRNEHNSELKRMRMWFVQSPAVLLMPTIKTSWDSKWATYSMWCVVLSVTTCLLPKLVEIASIVCATYWMCCVVLVFSAITFQTGEVLLAQHHAYFPVPHSHLATELLTNERFGKNWNSLNENKVYTKCKYINISWHLSYFWNKGSFLDFAYSFWMTCDHEVHLWWCGFLPYSCCMPIWPHWNVYAWLTYS